MSTATNGNTMQGQWALPGSQCLQHGLHRTAFRVVATQEQFTRAAPALRAAQQLRAWRRRYASRRAGASTSTSPAVRAAAGPASDASSKQRQVQVSHILLAADQEELASQLRQRIQGGEALGSLAEQHSSCPSRSNGGSIGWISRGQTVPEFEEAAFAAPVGAVSVCKSQFGVHVLQVTAEREAAEAGQMLPQELGASLQERSAGGNQEVQYVDVREEGEAEVAKLPHFQLFSLSKFEEWGPQVATGELLDRDRPVVVLCQNGIRSLQLSKWLVTQGFGDVRSVTGGITGYSLAVDPSIPQY